MSVIVYMTPLKVLTVLSIDWW